MTQTKKESSKLKWRTIQTKVPVCPICNSNMRHEFEYYKCTKCSYKCIATIRS